VFKRGIAEGQDFVRLIAFSPDGRNALCGSGGDTLKLWI
jgi:hypothetical protein